MRSSWRYNPDLDLQSALRTLNLNLDDAETWHKTFNWAERLGYALIIEISVDDLKGVSSTERVSGVDSDGLKIRKLRPSFPGMNISAPTIKAVEFGELYRRNFGEIVDRATPPWHAFSETARVLTYPKNEILPILPPIFPNSRKNPDEKIRNLEREWESSLSSETLRRYIVALLRSGEALKALALLLKNVGRDVKAWDLVEEYIQSFILQDALGTFSLLLNSETGTTIDAIRELTKDECPSLLPEDWKTRRGVNDDEPRFEVEETEGELEGSSYWQINDYAYATYLNVDTQREALRALNFSQKYVKKHGDIDLESFPYDINQPLHYDNLQQIIKWWTEDYP